jgi:hypothetical protein
MLNRALFSLLLFSSAALAQTQYGSAPVKPGSPVPTGAGCPWLTAGSAARTLGGEVSVTVKLSEMGEGLCSFSRQQGSPDSLEILVSKAALPMCPPDSTALKGIGNEALSCRHGGAHSDSVEMISSRVRDLHFTVTLTTRAQKTSAKTADAQSADPQNDALEQIAEQVAGNLY